MLTGQSKGQDELELQRGPNVIWLPCFTPSLPRPIDCCSVSELLLQHHLHHYHSDDDNLGTWQFIILKGDAGISITFSIFRGKLLTGNWQRKTATTNCKRQTANCKVHFALAAIAERASNWFCIAQIALQLSQLCPNQIIFIFLLPHSLSLSLSLAEIAIHLVALGGLNGLSVLPLSLSFATLVIFRFDSGQRAKLPVDFGFRLRSRIFFSSTLFIHASHGDRLVEWCYVLYVKGSLGLTGCSLQLWARIYTFLSVWTFITAKLCETVLWNLMAMCRIAALS